MYTTTTRDFQGIIYASDIITCDYLLDYINGKGQFYLENEFYPVTTFVYNDRNKKPFEGDNFKKGDGAIVATPRILVNVGGKYYRKFSIVWSKNLASYRKTTYMLNAYECWDNDRKQPLRSKASDGKIRTLEIPLTSMEPFEEASDDQKLALLAFHLSEVFALLTYAYIFDINLADNEFVRCKNNIELYHLFTDRINRRLDGIVDVIPDDEMIARFNDIPFYIHDPEDEDVTAMQVPAYNDGKGDHQLLTIQNFIYDGLFESTKKSVKLIDGIDKKIGERKTNILKLIGRKSAVSNKTILKSGETKDHMPIKSFQLKTQFRFLNTTNDVDRGKCAGLCTKVFDPEKKNWVPIDDEDYLMRLYRKRLSGDIYISFETKLVTIGKGAFGLKSMVDMFDVKVVERDSSSVISAATMIAMSRRADDKTEAIAQDIDPDLFYNETNSD